MPRSRALTGLNAQLRMNLVQMAPRGSATKRVGSPEATITASKARAASASGRETASMRASSSVAPVTASPSRLIASTCAAVARAPLPQAARDARLTVRRLSMSAMAAPASLRDLYVRPGFLLKRCHQVSAAIFLEECREYALTPSQYGALRVLQSFPGIDQVALGRLTGLDRSTTGLVVQLCLARGLIERAVNIGDKRRMHLRLAAKGKQMLRDIAPAAQRARERVLDGLPPGERRLFLRLLERFLQVHGATIDAEGVTQPSLQAAIRAKQRR